MDAATMDTNDVAAPAANDDATAVANDKPPTRRRSKRKRVPSKKFLAPATIQAIKSAISGRRKGRKRKSADAKGNATEEAEAEANTTEETVPKANASGRRKGRKHKSLHEAEAKGNATEEDGAEANPTDETYPEANSGEEDEAEANPTDETYLEANSTEEAEGEDNLCTVCCEMHPNENMVYCQEGTHCFCSGCVKMDWRSRTVKSKQEAFGRCMDTTCKSQYKPEQLLDLLTNYDISNFDWNTIVVDDRLTNNFCPFCAEPVFVENPEAGGPNGFCAHCLKAYCLGCRNPLHGGFTCAQNQAEVDIDKTDQQRRAEEVIDAKILRLTKDEEIVMARSFYFRCPNEECSIQRGNKPFTQRSALCNLLKCPACKCCYCACCGVSMKKWATDRGIYRHDGKPDMYAHISCPGPFLCKRENGRCPHHPFTEFPPGSGSVYWDVSSISSS